MSGQRDQGSVWNGPSQEALRDWESSGITGEATGVIGKGRAVYGRCVELHVGAVVGNKAQCPLS